MTADIVYDLLNIAGLLVSVHNHQDVIHLWTEPSVEVNFVSVKMPGQKTSSLSLHCQSWMLVYRFLLRGESKSLEHRFKSLAHPILQGLFLKYYLPQTELVNLKPLVLGTEVQSHVACQQMISIHAELLRYGYI